MTISKTPHIVRSFDKDLRRLDEAILQGFDLVELLLQDAILAVANHDLELAKHAIESDRFVDEVDLQTEQEAIRILTLRGPVADDLRWVLGALKVSAELECIGDLGKSLAMRVPNISEAPLPEAARGLQAMNMLVQDHLARMHRAWADKNTEAALLVRKDDEAVDALYESFFRDLLTHMMESHRNITSCTHLLFIAKNLERIGDHITHIAEILYFIDSGKILDHQSVYPSELSPSIQQSGEH